MGGREGGRESRGEEREGGEREGEERRQEWEGGKEEDPILKYIFIYTGANSCYNHYWSAKCYCPVMVAIDYNSRHTSHLRQR